MLAHLIVEPTTLHVENNGHHSETSTRIFFTTFQVVIKVITGDKFPRSIETLHCEYALSNDIIEGILFSEIQLSFLYK